MKRFLSHIFVVLALTLPGCGEQQKPISQARVNTGLGTAIEVNSINFEGHHYVVFSSNDSRGGVFVIEQKEVEKKE